MVQERLELETSKNSHSGSMHASLMASSRRRKGEAVISEVSYVPLNASSGPAFLPSEHDELPPGVAFMVCLSLGPH
jgi:hypothetical protein